MKKNTFNYGNYLITYFKQSNNENYELIIKDINGNVYRMQCGNKLLSQKQIIEYLRENFDEWV